ncbi:MAG: hypothetical protein LBI39_03460 [Puniceicoccales bacterium]|nr:hypothetical protein [Puniceicoccales bacterium]
MRICIFLLCFGTLCCGCASSGAGDAIGKVHSVAVKRAQVAEINRELLDLSQVFLYAGRMRCDETGALALDAALEIVGTPEDGEKELAMTLTAGDIRRRSARAAKLMAKKERHIGEIDELCRDLCVAISELQAARRSVAILGNVALASGFAIAMALLFFRRR